MQLHHHVPHNLQAAAAVGENGEVQWETRELICESKRLEGKQRATTTLFLVLNVPGTAP